MRKTTSGTLVLIGLGALVTALPAGCFFNLAGDCEFNMTLECFYAGAGGSGGTGGTGGAGGSPAECIPSAENAEIDPSCGVFVSPAGSDADGDGSKEKPYATLGMAISKGVADAKPVYPCADEAQPFSEALSLSDEVTIYGGLNCAKDWTYDPAKKTAWTAPADAVPLFVKKGGVATMFDVKIEAAAATEHSGSSIAVIADEGATLELTRCDVIAGDAADGQDGLVGFTNTGPSNADDPEIKGNDGQDACTATDMQFGGAQKENPYCPLAMGGPLGGSGGVGAVGTGEAGSSQPMATTQTAQGGVGQPADDPMNMWSCATGVGQGNSGANGASGTPGLGASGMGTISTEGYTGEAGDTGGIGKPGQGGGGGGGAKGKALCAGASGGGGGTGGCGGAGGTGGKPGGASIGILSLQATLILDAVTIATGKGGKGGDGGFGQGGAPGGNGGNGGAGDVGAPATLDACNGGKGGQGGKGGDGGGGRGGPSVGVAFTGAPPDVKGASFEVGEAGGAGLGEGGTGTAKAAVACSTLRFDQGEESCVK